MTAVPTEGNITRRRRHLRGPGFGIDDPATLVDIQGNILAGYRASHVRHLVVRVGDPTAARAFIGAVVSGRSDVPQVMTAVSWQQKPVTCLNVAITHTGLVALGLDERSLQTFPYEFQQGAAARAHKVGDVGASEPEQWLDGLGNPDRAHLMWSIHALSDLRDLERVASTLEAIWLESRAFVVTSRLDAATFDTYPGHTAAEGATVHFGYRDSISQPRFQLPNADVGLADSQPLAPVGAVLLGEEYATPFPDIAWQMPKAYHGTEEVEFGRNGCFNAFRMLRQDVVGFERFLVDTADQINRVLDARYPGRNEGQPPRGEAGMVWDRERVAAKLMGRWRNGVPLSPSHRSGVGGEDFRGPGMPEVGDETQLNDFDYPDTNAAFDDSDGTRCPLGAHIRRGNPRGSRIVERSANYTRPIVRRGMPYGPPCDLTKDGAADGPEVERGLIGNFLCASLVAQFEAIMYDWINLGLHDPRLTGTNDVVIGANVPRESRFEIPLAGTDPDDPGALDPPIVVTGFPSFTTTRVGLYLFVPSLTALRFLADAPSNSRLRLPKGTPRRTADGTGDGSGDVAVVADPPERPLRWRVRRRFWNRLAILKFKGQKATVIRPPGDALAHVALVPFVTRHPKIPIDDLALAERLPDDEVDRAKQVFTTFQHALVRWYPPMVAGLPEVPADGEAALAAAYTPAHRRCFPAPVRPEGMADLGVLAVASPYASYLVASGDGSFRWDVTHLGDFEVHQGLRPLGALVDFSLDHATGSLHAARIETSLGVAVPGSLAWADAQRMAVCSITTHASLIRHFNWLHLVAGPVLEAATRNHLPTAHPLCRFVWMHVFGTHAGNELVTEILMSKGGEFDSIFSFSHRGKCELFEATLGQFDLASINPRTDAARRGVAELASPARENWTALYDVCLAHARRYLTAYYTSDDAVANDGPLQAWIGELEQRLPHGVTGVIGSVADRDGVAALLATVLYLATVEHEITGSGVWDYQLWPDSSPVRISADGRRVPLDVYQRLVNANFNLNVHRTMLLDDTMAAMALDRRGVTAFVQFQQDLLALQADLDRSPACPWRLEPRRLKANINA